MGLFKKIRKLFNKKLENLRERECDLKNFKLHQDLFTTLYKLRLVENAVNVGQKVPINDLKTCFGEEIKIDELLQKGPVVLKFYRGTWCNYCETDLAFLNENVGFLEAEGATAIAIATQPEASMAENARACNYRFHSVSDTDRSISKKFGLLFKIPEAIIEAYRRDYNVDTDKLLGVRDVSLPATYVINKNGEVVYASMNEDFRTRASIDEVIYYVKKAKQDKKRYFTLCEKEECKIKNFVKGALKKAEEKWEEKKEERKEEKRLSKISFGKRGSIQSLTLSEFAKDPLGYCLQNPEFLESFKDYLNKTFCTENLLFYLETVDFHSHWSARTEEERRSEAQRIFDTFIIPGAELEVNLDDVTRELLVQGLKEQAIPAEFYEKSSREIYNLMEADSFSKWKRTRDYAVIWKREGSPDFLSPYPTTAEAA